MINSILKINKNNDISDNIDIYKLIKESLDELIENHKEFIKSQKLMFINLNEEVKDNNYELIKNKDQYINNNTKTIKQHFDLFYINCLKKNSDLLYKIRVIESAIKDNNPIKYYYYHLDEIIYNSIEFPEKEYFLSYIKKNNKDLHYWMLDKDKMKKKFENNKTILIKTGNYTTEEIINFFNNKYKPSIQEHYKKIKNNIKDLDDIKISNKKELHRKEQVFIVLKNYYQIQMNYYIDSFLIFNKIIDMIFKNLIEE